MIEPYTDTLVGDKRRQRSRMALLGRILLGLLVYVVVCVYLAYAIGCGGTQKLMPGPTTVRDVAGNLSQTFEQQMGLPPATIAKLAVCFVGWALAFGSFGWMMRPPQSWWARGVILSTIIFLIGGLPLILFVYMPGG